MAQEIRLPRLGDTMEEGAVLGCRVKLGDQVRRGDIVFDIETDKTTVEMESSAEGFVRAILIDVGQTAPVGAALLVLGTKEETISQKYLDSLQNDSPPASATSIYASAPVVTPPPFPPHVTAGPTVVFDPVSPTHYKLGQKIAASPLQKSIAQKMLQSKREIPCFYLNIKTDVTALVAFREKLNSAGDIKVSFNDYIMFALAKALRQFPIMTGQLAGDYIRLADTIGIGLAIALPDGFVAPILHDVDKKNIKEIAAESKGLITKAKAGQLLPADIEGGCITLSNLGAFGVEAFIPIVMPGQCSILGAGRIIETCVPADGHAMTVRKLMCLTLSVDHKVANGAYAAQFLEYIKKLLEDTDTFA
ncbi:MAG: dihydrolipoamide acetyltransferase family protein [Sedimentisphaerales bacterium]|nr:dihydrolipoamide acetyltransferase family protein [Sedimentisphaerales bacterium]